MPLDPVAAIIQFESSGCTNMQNPTSSASGCGGMLDSTWRSVAPTIGIDPGLYPHMKDAPVPDQLAATAALYNRRGFADYTCAGCDKPLADYISSHGGISAFSAPGTLTTDPAAYQTYLPYSSPLASGGISPLTGLGSSSIPSQSQSTTASVSFDFKPFEYTHTLYRTNIETGLQDVVAKALTQAGLYIDIALALALLITVLQWGYNQISSQEFKTRLGRFTVVILFLSPPSLYYQTFVVSFFLHAIPAWTAGVVSGGAGNETGPTAAFDGVFFKVYSMGWTAAKSLSIASDGIAMAFFGALLILASVFVITVVLGLMYAIWLVVQTLLAVAVGLGPFLVFLLLFSYTASTVHLWVASLIGLSIASLGINIVVALVGALITSLIQSVASKGGDAHPVLGLATAAIVLVILYFSVKELKSLLMRMGAAGVPSMDGAGALSAATRLLTRAGLVRRR